MIMNFRVLVVDSDRMLSYVLFFISMVLHDLS